MGNKFAVVGVDVVRVNGGKNIPMLELNRIKTVFGRNRYVMENGERILAWDENIPPEQEALLRGHNLSEYPTIQGLSVGKGTADSGTVQGNGVKFSLDSSYAEAVEAGDRKKVAMMVKDAVKAAMPNTKAVDRWGKPRLLYHGTLTRSIRTCRWSMTSRVRAVRCSMPRRCRWRSRVTERAEGASPSTPRRRS